MSSSRATVHLDLDRPETDDEDYYYEWNLFQFLLIFISLCVFLLMSLGLTLVWVISYADGFQWKKDSERMFNFHPVLMVGGFVTLGGFSMIMFRMCPCCGRTTKKMIHLVLYIATIPCIVVGLFAAIVSDVPERVDNRPNLTLLHTWIGIITIVLFIIEFVIGILAYGILLWFSYSVEYVRLGMASIHAYTGKITFMLSIAACLTGLSLKQAQYSSLASMELLTMNLIGLCIIFSALIVMAILR